MDKRPFLIKSIGCFEKNFPFFISRDVIDGYIPMHQHEFVEFEYTISGHGSETINGISHLLKPGNLTVLFPWDCHDLRADSNDPLCFFKINMDIELFMVNTSPLYKLRKIPFGKVNQRQYVQFADERFAEILCLFERMEYEFNSDNIYREMMFFIKIAEIFMEFDLLREPSGNHSPHIQGDIWKVFEFIHQNYSKELLGVEISQKFNLTKEEMDKQLLIHTGMAFDELVTDTRIRNACARLIYHTVPIGQIARETGHKTEDAFLKIFKRIKGMSPINYRKKYVKTENSLFSPEDIDARVIHYIHCHYSEDISLGDIAKLFHYNENYLHQLIKAQTGQTFSDVLQEVRIFHAASRLLTSNDPVVQIGFEVGFKSNETFLRIFRNHFGCSPSSYRKKGIESSEIL